jgi:Cell division protein FtsQ
VLVRAERPVAVLRQGSQGWLVSASARVLRQLDRPFPELPRIWIPRNVTAPVGSTLTGLSVSAVRAVAPLGRSSFLTAVRSVRAEEGELTLVLGSGLEVRVGDTRDLALKLAVARRLLPRSEGAVYVDVSVPERSVVGYSSATTDSQVEG